MSVLLITYDLNDEDIRPPIVDAIKELGSSYVQLSESCYAIVTSKSPRDVYEQLEDMIDENDDLYIITLKNPAHGCGDRGVIQWLEQNLEYCLEY